MKTDEMVKDYLYRAKWCLKEAEMALSGENYPMCVRRSQEALELVVKSLLRSLAIEYPREHDVGDALGYIEEKLPDYLFTVATGSERSMRKRI
ncbi:MAG: HEPN domain-containing protein [Halobacteriota archaeon]